MGSATTAAPSISTAPQSIADHGWPDDLTELPGVGRYTADAVASRCFGAKVLPVDVNVRRVLERSGLELDHECGPALMSLGAQVCIARIPRCDVCPLADACPSRGMTFEPARKQSPYEGSFRQRRARTLRLVAAQSRLAAELDVETVSALARDGLVEIRAGLVRLAE